MSEFFSINMSSNRNLHNTTKKRTNLNSTTMYKHVVIITVATVQVTS